MPVVRKKADNLLIEIGTEELPPKALYMLGKTFAESIVKGLGEAGLISDDNKYRWFATPRRLAVWVSKVRVRQSQQTIERRGPALQAAFEADGTPTIAALGFARSCGVDVAELGRAEEEKGTWLVFKQVQKGSTASKIVPECIERSLKQLPIPKRMRWGNGDDEFVRPVNWLAVVHGKRPIRCRIFSIRSGNVSYGHRFHHPRAVPIANADVYEANMTKAYVIADFEKRREQILQQIERIDKKQKFTTVIDKALLDEVTALVEWPQALVGEFDKSFLKLPAEVLISSMQGHQKYFHVTNSRGTLLPNFITVSNINSKSPKRVRSGNERVLRARLADAQFFWETDRKQPLEARYQSLTSVLFHRKLGSVHDKAQRMQKLAGFMAGIAKEKSAPYERAALLAKTDLVSEMVGEFPELQGVIGRYYAVHDGEDEMIADAIAQHYQPRFAGDTLPANRLAQSVSIADKIDSITGLFAIDETPSGDKDPYGLRRAALGVLRIIIEQEFDLDLVELITLAADSLAEFPGVECDQASRDTALDFMLDRLRAYYADAFEPDEIAAVIECRPGRPLDFDLRLKAVAEFRKMEQAQSLSAANKRIRNIMRKADDQVPDMFSDALLTDAGERELASALVEVSSDVWPLITARRYTEALSLMANFRGPIDRFFDEVMVMTDDGAVRANRLALLDHVSRLFLSIADISKLQMPN